MNILVTGANGQLGHEMQRVAKSSNHNYIFTDVADGYEKLDITNIEEIRNMVKNNNVDIIVNCAAYTNVDKAESDYDTADLINNTAAGNLAAAMKEVGGTLIHISTDYVFQGDRNTPCQEDWATKPLGVYGKTKLAGEKAIEATGCNHIIIRTAWLYSTFGNNFVKTMIKLGKTKEQIGVIADQIGTPTYARDLAVAIMTAIEKGIKPGVYHFSNEGVISWYDFTKAIHRIAGITTCRVKPLHTCEYPTAANRPAYSVLDKTKFKTAYDVEIPYWEESLKECIDKLDIDAIV